MQDQEAVGLWEQSLTILSDKVYMDIVRNFIGKIPTPFHKPQLTKRLTNLFLNPDFRQNIVYLLSDQDKQLLSATHILGTPTQDEICAIFDERVPYATLLNNLINLEERLLLVPNPNSLTSRYEIMVNPILLDLLTTTSLSFSTIFPSINSDTPTMGFRLSGADPSILQALISLHIHESLGTLDKSERLLKNKIGPIIFGSDKSEFINKLLYYNQLLYHEDVVKQQGKGSRIHLHKADGLIRLDRNQLQMRLFITAWHIHMQQQGINHTSDDTLRSFFSNLSNFLYTIPIDTMEDLVMACKIVAFRNGLPLDQAVESVSLLKLIGLTEPSSNKTEEQIKESTRLVPTIDSDLTISFTGELQHIDKRNLLHVLAVARKVDIVSSYEISKASIMRAFDLGLSVEDIIAYLKDLTHTEFKHLENLIRHWRDEFKSITIYDGIIVKADERQSRIIDALPQLREHIVASITPGIYLFSRTTEPAWRDILTATGIGFLPSSITETHSVETKAEMSDFFHEVDTRNSVEPLSIYLPEPLKNLHENSLSKLRKTILAKASNPSEREEMLARLERKLILIPEQISAVQGPSRTMQASGFDYQGKINLCKAAINSTSDLLELHLLDDMGNSQMLLAEAKEFIPSVKEPSIRVLILPQGEERVISLNTLFKVRKLRRSVFFQM